jgi:hypothetical protein
VTPAEKCFVAEAQAKLGTGKRMNAIVRLDEASRLRLAEGDAFGAARADDSGG